MARRITLGLNQEYSLVAVGLLSVLSVIHKSNGFEFQVGGSGSWKVPSDPNAAVYNHWAEKNRFQLGDTLLFAYPADQDSVLHVTKEDYANCTTASPLQKFADGHTIFTFNQSGPHYFISGVVEHCLKNEKLAVVVMADRRNHHNNSNQTAFSPSPAPAGQESSSTSEVPTPSPAPAGEESPSPPPSAVEINPTPPPSHESPPHKNAAAAMIGNINAAFVGLILLVLAS